MYVVEEHMMEETDTYIGREDNFRVSSNTYDHCKEVKEEDNGDRVKVNLLRGEIHLEKKE